MTNPKLLYSIEQPHGLGEVYFAWQRGEGKSLLATTGTDATLAIHDRHGQLLERIQLPGLCVSMEWDSDGDLLAAVTPNGSGVLLWECHGSRVLTVETGLREAPSCLAWAPAEPLLAVPTVRGNLALYNHHTTKRIPIIGKHSKRITCAAWNRDSILALAAEDKTLSLSNSDGDTLRVLTLRDLPQQLCFSEMKTDERAGGENTVSVLVGKRSLYLYNLLEPDSPVELAFQAKYGGVAHYRWYGDGYVLLAFSAGYVIAISTHLSEVGQELFHVKVHKDGATCLDVCDSAGLALSCGDGQVKALSLWEGGEVVWSEGAGGAERAAWSADGRLAAVAARAAIHVYVCALPALAAATHAHALTLTSLSEATLYACVPTDDRAPAESGPVAVCTFSLPVEASVLALGPGHAACARDSIAWLFTLGSSSPPTRRSYPAPISKLLLSATHVAALYAGRVMLHAIDEVGGASADRESIVFPEPHEPANITDMALTNDLLILVTEAGGILYWGTEEWGWCARHRAAGGSGTGGGGDGGGGLRAVYSDIAGARCVVADGRGRAHVHLPLSQELLELPDLPAQLKGVVWDICLSERGVLVAWGAEAAHTYYAAATSTRGPHARLVAATPLPPHHTPLILFAGDLYCSAASAGGSIAKVELNSHHTAGLADADAERRVSNQRRHIDKLLALRRFGEAWLYCEAIEEREYWTKLAEAAVESLDVAFAMRVYTRLNDVAMVWSLEDAATIEDLSMLCGRLCACLGRSDAAAAWLEGAGGGGGAAALELHAARGDWQRAAALAARHAPDKLPALTKHHAHHLEFTADYHDALSNYEKSVITGNTDDIKTREHNEQCEAGIARTAIRCGDVMRGVALAVKRNDVTLLKECAQILEEEKHYNHAATLYEQAEDIEKAAVLYIKLKSWSKVENLLSKISSPAVHILYAKSVENEGRFNEALQSYLKAQDFESAIRLNIEKLEDIDDAVRLVQETKSVQGAKMVANYFQKHGDSTSAIKFLVMSLCYDEAFHLARKHGKLQLYGDILIQTAQARPDDFRSLALHFEGERNSLLAGKFYFHARQYGKAMLHLLKVESEDDQDEAIGIAIDVAAASEDERLSRRLTSRLLGEGQGEGGAGGAGGAPRDPAYLLRLYMAKRQWAEAANTAVIICESECAAGRYGRAREVARGMCGELVRRGVRAGREVRRALHVLHAYALVRLHVRRARHLRAARLLLLLARNTHYFPMHVVAILTSTVIECSRAGLKRAAYRWARALMADELRGRIEPKYAKKIESVVRHPPRAGAGGSASGSGSGDAGAGADADAEPATPCPVCGAPSPETELVCVECKTDIPFCIVTGCHIVKDDLTACPECDFPAIKSEFEVVAREEGRCPMCEEAVDERRLVAIDDVTPYLDTKPKE